MPDVTIFDDGSMQVVVDGVHWLLPLDAVRALADRIPDAEAAEQRQELTAATRSLVDILVTSGPDMAATVTVNADTLTATVDDSSFDQAAATLGGTVNPDGSITAGPITLHRADPPAMPTPAEPPAMPTPAEPPTEPTPTEPTETSSP